MRKGRLEGLSSNFEKLHYLVLWLLQDRHARWSTKGEELLPGTIPDPLF